MTKYVETDELLNDTNVSLNETLLYIVTGANPSGFYLYENFWDTKKDTKYSKIQIKETDMRIKTANFTSPQYLDLTNGQYVILIASTQHENFMGEVLDCEYDEKTGLYSYKCQDWSRKYMTKVNFNINGTHNMYNVIRGLVTRGRVSWDCKYDELVKYRRALSGVRRSSSGTAHDIYNQKYWGSIIGFNPMSTIPYIRIRDKSYIQIIRDLILGTGAYIDIYFNDYGILQLEPYSKEDFENTGVKIDPREISEVNVKFDTTNIITGAIVRPSDEVNLEGTEIIKNEVLQAFYGYMLASISNPDVKVHNNSNTTSTTSKTSSNNNGNPYGSKAKKIWINSDNGSCSFKNSVANILKNKGWTVHNGGCCSNCHYSDYFNVTSDYQVYATLYNGFCAGTIREAYSSSIQNTLKKKGVQLVVMWDTSSWTNPNGMKPYRYGDFTGYNAGRAWDDNFSSSDPSIKNVASWLKSKGAKYCASPTAEGVVEQFLAGGYFAYKGK